MKNKSLTITKKYLALIMLMCILVSCGQETERKTGGKTNTNQSGQSVENEGGSSDKQWPINSVWNELKAKSHIEAWNEEDKTESTVSAKWDKR